MEPTTTILGGLVVALVAGIAGKFVGEKNGVKQSVCEERRTSCQALLVEKIDNLSDRIESLTRTVDNKLTRI